MRIMDEREIALQEDACLVQDVSVGTGLSAAFWGAAVLAVLLVWVALKSGISGPILALGLLPATLFVYVWRRLRRPGRTGGPCWRAAITKTGVYARLGSPSEGAGVLHLSLDEIAAAQRCTRNFATGFVRDTYLDLLADPEALAALPARPLVTSPAFGELARSGHRVSWDGCRVRIALPSTLLERAPAVGQALEALEHLGMAVLEPRWEFWPTGFNMFLERGQADVKRDRMSRKPP